MAFPNDIAAGDTFLQALGSFIGSNDEAPTLSDAFTQVDATTTGATNSNFIVVDLELRDSADDGQNNSFTLLVASDHAFGNAGIVS